MKSGDRVEAWNPKWYQVGFYQPDLSSMKGGNLWVQTGMRGTVTERGDDGQRTDVLWDDGKRGIVWNNMLRKLGLLELIAEAAQ